MKRIISLYIVFFLFCGLAAPQKSHAIVPLAVIPAAQIGASLAIAALVATGTYVAINNSGSFGDSSRASSSGSFPPDDPGGLTMITAPMLFYSKVMQAGAQIALGATFDGLISAQNLFDSAVLKANSAWNQFLFDLFPQSDPAAYLDGLNITCPSNVTCAPGTVAHLQFVSDLPNAYQNSTVALLQAFLDTPINPLYGNGTYASWFDVVGTAYYQTHNMHTYSSGFAVDRRWYQVSYIPGTIAPAGGVPETLTDADKEKIADALPGAANANPALADAVKGAIVANPAIVENLPAAITAADIAAAVQSGTSAANQTLIDILTALVAANPDNAELKAELAKAIAEAAKERAKEVAEPNYSPPSSWYTPVCNRDDIASCIEYQPVIDATSSLKNTTIYQVPHLLATCLGYVEGNNCQYPPKLEVDFHNAFSSAPISIDLIPFSSVVAILKFFFAILFFVGTYRLTMDLFR